MAWLLPLMAFPVLFYVLRYVIRKKRREARLHKYLAKYGREFGALIADRRIAIGMSLEMVRDAWGPALKADSKIIRANYIRQGFYFGAYKDKQGKTRYKFHVMLENDRVKEIREG